MIFELSIITVFVLVCGIIYKTPFFNRKYLFHGKINLVQFIFLFGIPLVLGSLTALIFTDILARPRIEIIHIGDNIFIALLFITYAFFNSGFGIHTLAKMLNYYIGPTEEMVHDINSFFHKPLSHLMVIVNSSLFAFLLAMFEINHPASPANISDRWALILLCVIIGLSCGTFIYFYGNQLLRYLSYLFLLIAFTISTIFIMHLDLRVYPFYLMIIVIYVSSFAALLIQILRNFYLRKRISKHLG